MVFGSSSSSSSQYRRNSGKRRDIREAKPAKNATATGPFNGGQSHHRANKMVAQKASAVAKNIRKNVSDKNCTNTYTHTYVYIIYIYVYIECGRRDMPGRLTKWRPTTVTKRKAPVFVYLK